MSIMVSLTNAQANLKQLIDKLAPGEKIVITENEQPVATLVGQHSARPPRPAPGLGKGSILHMAADFDEPLEEFREYME